MIKKLSALIHSSIFTFIIHRFCCHSMAPLFLLLTDQFGFNSLVIKHTDPILLYGSFTGDIYPILLYLSLFTNIKNAHRPAGEIACGISVAQRAHLPHLLSVARWRPRKLQEYARHMHDQKCFRSLAPTFTHMYMHARTTHVHTRTRTLTDTPYINDQDTRTRAYAHARTMPTRIRT